MATGRSQGQEVRKARKRNAWPPRHAAEEARKARKLGNLAEAKAQEVRRAEEAERLAAEVRAEEARKAEEAWQLAEAKAQEVRRAEEAVRLAAEARAEEARKAEEAWQLAEAKAQEVRRAEEAVRFAAEARAEEVWKAEQAWQLAEAKVEEARRAEEAERPQERAERLAGAKAEEIRRALEAERLGQSSANEAKWLAEASANSTQKRKEDERVAEQKILKGRDTGLSVAALQIPQAVAPAPQDLGSQQAGSSAHETHQAEKLLQQGEKYLVLGNIVVARQYFLRSAMMGYASAAFRLAETYDPKELRQMNVLGPYPDPDEAKRWYRAAVDLGANGAEGRLARLTAD